MRRLILIAALIVSGSFSCSIVMESNTKFEKLTSGFFDGFLELNPQWATGLGDHRFDHMLDDYSPEGIEKEKTFYLAYLDSLKGIDSSKLNETNRIDYQILKNRLESSYFNLDTLRGYEWSVTRYNPGGAIYSLIARDFAPLSVRMKSVMARLNSIPARVEQAEANLKNPPKIHTETAIRQIKGTISMIRDDLNPKIDSLPELKSEFEVAQAKAVAALEDYAEWLEKDLLPESNGDFRLGEAKFRSKLRYTLNSDLSKEDILARAVEDLAKTQKEIFEVASPLYKKFFPKKQADVTIKHKVVRAVLDRLAEDRPDAENIVEFAELSLKLCTDFVRDKGLVTVPDEPIDIIVMPEFERGFAVAYCDSPGPLEKGAKTFFAISPPPSYWDDDRVESYFREYNNYMVWDLTIHEAMPGHYLQLAHANKFNAPTMIRSIFGSGTFTEGWATYAEQFMAEYGFGGPEEKMEQLKMRLRMIINAIIDQKIHTEGMTEKEAMDMMINDGYQEDGEAAGKWIRACLSSTQLSTYYIGNIEINEIRDAYKAEHGEDLDIKAFHDRMLSYGSPPPKYVKEMMGL